MQRASRPEEAQSLFAGLLKQSPTNPQVLQAYAAFQAGRDNGIEAERIFKQAIQFSSNDPIAHVRLGLFYQQQGRPDDAARQLRVAIQVAPANTYAHHNLAVVYLSQKKIAETEKELALAVKADPRYPPPVFLLGQIRFAQKRYREALQRYSAALALSIEPNQQQEIKERIQEAENALLSDRIAEARSKAERKDYPAAWSIFAEELKKAPDQRLLRDAILEFELEHSAAANLSLLPPCRLKEIMATPFWRAQVQAEQIWQNGQKAQALRMISSATGAMNPAERTLLLSVYFNLRNERHGIHGKICQWALRHVEERDYAGAVQLLDEAIRQHVFGVVPGISPLTIDSLMIPPDMPEPKKFSDFEVAHHPDRRVHEAYAAAQAGMGSLGEVRRYLMAVEVAKPDLSARLSAAKACRQEQKWSDAIVLLSEGLPKGEPDPKQKDLLPDYFVLLADVQCRTGDCAAALNTLEAGLRLLPNCKPVKDAIQRLKSSSRRIQ